MKSIIIDSNEPSSIKDLSFGTVPKTIMPLDYGDFWIATDGGKMLAIERKTPNDFISSIKSGAIFHQVEKMKAGMGEPYVLITGSILPTKSGISIFDESSKRWLDFAMPYTTIQGALLKIQNQGCPIVYAADSADLSPTLFWLEKHADKEQYVIKPRKKVYLFSQAESFLASLPNIGDKKAVELLKEFPNAAAALWYLTDLSWSGEKITGIGDATKKKIVEFLGSPIIPVVENQ